MRSYPHQTSWFLKFCECVLAAVGILSVLAMPLEMMPTSFWVKYGQYAQYILPVLGGLALLSGVGYSIVWHRRERAGLIVDSGLRHAWLQAIIRYWLAFEISTYGFAKILKSQFSTPNYRLDMALSDLNGFQLTWYYYGYSYTLAVIIALFQIGGSCLLLFRRTTLLGVMILLPVMVNIVFINVFYNIAVGAFFNSVMFTLGLLLFLFLDVDKLKRAFWDLIERLPPIASGRGQWLKNGARVLPIILAFATMQVLLKAHPNEKVLAGTWKVESLMRNGQAVPMNSWQTDTTAWNRVYFAGWQGVAFSPNPYRYKPTESWRGEYEFDSTTNKLKIFFERKEGQSYDTMQATVANRTAKAMTLQGQLHRDTYAMKLTRLR
ncbi:hypothetical protein [Spirosoma rhododendri]|uniref:hypothetical protein n=1 Tax=Spirosoma rhododendri TaxID=2728024 RepID=UPI0020C2A354|nr:hypothetical protein [Spirosoma rhododendri]